MAESMKMWKRKKKVINRIVDNFVDKLFLKTIHSRLLKDFDVKSLAESFLNCKSLRWFCKLYDALMFFVGFFQEFSKEKLNCTNNVHLNKN